MELVMKVWRTLTRVRARSLSWLLQHLSLMSNSCQVELWELRSGPRLLANVTLTLMERWGILEPSAFCSCVGKIWSWSFKNSLWGYCFGFIPFVALEGRSKYVSSNILYSVQVKEWLVFEDQNRTSFWCQLVFTFIIGKKNYKKINSNMSLCYE